MRKLLIVFMASIIVPVKAVLSLELNIPTAPQEKSEWCWAACCQMTLLYYDLVETQEDIVAEIFVLPTVNYPLALYNTYANRGVNWALKEFGEEEIGETYYTDGTLSKDDIFQSIDELKPMIINMNMGDYYYHMVLIKGYIDDNPTNPTIIINNPDEDAEFLLARQMCLLPTSKSVLITGNGKSHFVLRKKAQEVSEYLMVLP